MSAASARDTTRVRVWLKLRSLGTLDLQQTVCLLPDRDPVRQQVSRLLRSVRDDGKTARSVSIFINDPTNTPSRWPSSTRHATTNTPKSSHAPADLLEVLQQETACGRATYAEVEESDAALERFHQWLAKISARDYVEAKGAAAAREAVEHCRAALQAFEDAAITAETGPRSAARRARA
ncbi:Chromate resistance protein ChrB [Streptomyces sp. TP-A0356]|uniref:Chromate resistance protein ChrB n=1 Tax=Streptomyces sp. TP-A0356 TaxID=1359208 RepID=UPI000AD8B57C|nr:Chromate resistance protein ChrB [Streptomyces sp. TP-A0356]